MSLKKYLDYIKETKKITAGEFAKKIGVSQSTLSLWASGKVLPSQQNIEKLTKATGGKVTYADFYEDNVVPFPVPVKRRDTCTFDLIQAAVIEMQAHMMVALVYDDLEGAEITYSRFQKKMETLFDEWEAEKK